MIGAYSTNERPDQHCAEIGPLNLVKVDRRPDEISLPQINPISKVKARNQRQNPDRYCLCAADIQESTTTDQALDRTEKPKKKLSESERPVDCRPQTYLKDSFVPDCVDQVSADYGSWLTGQFFLTGQVITMGFIY